MALGAYGAHALKPEDPHYKMIFERANHYHMAHSLLLALSPVARQSNLVAGLAVAGIALFSGSLYAVALYENRSYGWAAPYGGFAFMFAWLALAL